MASFFHDNRDLQLYFDEGVDWDSLVGEFAAEQIAPTGATFLARLNEHREVATAEAG